MRLLMMIMALSAANPAWAGPVDIVGGGSCAADQRWKTNVEMTAIFNADQADRSSLAVDWSIVRPRDEARAARTKALLDEGLLASGDDYYHAAFVFQHGAQPNDYLLAHALAMVAVARGRRDATWIAAATLDRYLQRIGQQQNRLSACRRLSERGRERLCVSYLERCQLEMPC